MMAHHRVGFSYGEGQQPLPIWPFKEGESLRGKEV